MDGSQLLALTIGCLLVGTVAGFGWAMDRQLRGGVLDQRTEAMQRADWVPISRLPGYIPRTFVAVVDPSFEDGAPVRPRDASHTIPRELVRQIHLLGNGLGGQAKEMMMAPILEKRIPDEAVLELYLNRVYFGMAHDYPVYGIHYAAREYFGKEAAQLTLGETATLAGLLLEPRIERPEDMAGAVGARRNEVLTNLLRTGYITEADMKTAVAERLAFQPGITEVPMTRQVFAVTDTTVIQLPPPSPPAD